MHWKFEKVFPFLIILVGLIGVLNLLHSGFYTSHDGRHQIIRLMYFHQGLLDGQMPVRWAGTALMGYGYPLFIFTYRLPFWLAEAWYVVFPNLGNAIKFVFILSFILSGLSMYWFAFKIWENRLAGLLSAILYMWAPYRFVNIFVRASLGEAVSFVFIPLVFLSIYSLQTEKRKFLWQILLAVSLAGLVLSHAIALSLWLIPFALWFLFNLYLSKYKNDFTLTVFVSNLISLFLSAYYWLPAFTERKYVKFSSMIGNYYQAHFVTLRQLLYSKWGFGFSLPGVENDMMSFQVGLAQWLAIAAVGIVIGSVFADKRLKKNKLLNKFINLNKLSLLLNLVFILIFIVSIFLMTDASHWFYANVKKLFVIDIPWRFLGVSVFSASIIGGGLINLLKNKYLKSMLIITILFLAFYGNRNHLRVNQYVYTPDSEYWQSYDTSSEYDDYAPKDIDLTRINVEDQDLVTLSGVSTNKMVIRRSNMIRFYSEVKSDKAEIIVKSAYYPGWEALIDNKQGKITLFDGKIKFNLSKGNHLITLLFRETKLRRFSNWLSLLTLLGLVIFTFKYARNESKK